MANALGFAWRRDRVRLTATVTPEQLFPLLGWTRMPPEGQPLVAVARAEQLEVLRYTDALPEVQEEVVLVASGVYTHPDVQVDPTSGVLHLMYHTEGTIGHRTSVDRGETWITMTNIGTGSGVSFVLNEESGMLVAAVWDGTVNWTTHVSTLNEAGTEWTTVVGGVIVADGTASGEIRLRRGGEYEFAYLDTEGDVKIVRCTDLSSAGVGTWS